MAQIIKNTGKPPVFSPKSFVIKKHVFEEQEAIKKLYREANQEQEKILSDAEKQAESAKQEGILRGANQASLETAELAVQIFLERKETYLDLKTQLERLSVEIAQKILGGPLALSKSQQEPIFLDAVQQLRSQRKLKIQLEKPELLATFEDFPEFELEKSSDLPPDSMRVITEAGEVVSKVLTFQN